MQEEAHVTQRTAPGVVRVWRGDVIESRHRVHVAVVGADGSLRCFAGDPSLVVFARSAVKLVQAIPLLEDGVAEAFGFTIPELALCCASHSGEPMHVELAASMLRKIGAGEESLACGPHAPYYEGAADALRAEGREPGRLHNNCSGKHAGMLALARHHGWPLAGYHELDHPVQQRMLAEIARWGGISERAIATAVDGCAVVTFGLSVEVLARTFARFATAARRNNGMAARVVQAMVQNPAVVAGTNRLCTALVEATHGRIFAKVGAEGVYCAGVPGAELGIALKVEDGAGRAAETALLAVLHQLGVLSSEELGGLQQWVTPQIRNTRGERVGYIDASIELEGGV
ncbi:MAG: asparaginase [Longimicrobiales bacterium]